VVGKLSGPVRNQARSVLVQWKLDIALGNVTPHSSFMSARSSTPARTPVQLPSMSLSNSVDEAVPTNVDSHASATERFDDSMTEVVLDQTPAQPELKSSEA
jgi:hypothetical protein